jgi:biopolymer transport protein ExbB/TolQ
MVISVIMLIFLITVNFTKIKGYFMHSPVLNGLMLVVVCFGLIMAFHNNYAIWQVARLLKRIENIQDEGPATSKQVRDLRTQLEKKAHLLSMANFTALLGNLESYGHLNINDTEARLIKGKFGARINHDRGMVNYFCGILVMLGLIGTFWGLLGTITSVGQAMTKISESFAAQATAGGGGEVDMGGFLQSISKPLEGMGVGFSASLFGLTGSLFLGFFNYLCSHSQNAFIENFGRWIDDRIPKMSDRLAERVKDARVPGGDDLKSWLAGFIYLANKSNQRMSQLFSAFAKANANTTKSISQTEQLFGQQKEILKAIETTNLKMTGIQNAITGLGADLKASSVTMQGLPEGLAQLSEALSNQAKLQQKTMTAQMEQLAGLIQQIHENSASMVQMNEVQASVLNEIGQLKQQAANGHDMAEVSVLAAQVNTLLEEIWNKNDEGIMEIFHQGRNQRDREIKAPSFEGDH